MGAGLGGFDADRPRFNPLIIRHRPPMRRCVNAAPAFLPSCKRYALAIIGALGVVIKIDDEDVKFTARISLGARFATAHTVATKAVSRILIFIS